MYKKKKRSHTILSDEILQRGSACPASSSWRRRRPTGSAGRGKRIVLLPGGARRERARGGFDRRGERAAGVDIGSEGEEQEH
jgi:hypothetical protein